MEEQLTDIKLTQFAKNSGCGCKISPQQLSEILQGNQQHNFDNLLVGNNTNDDAAVYAINSTEALISATDFFTPIVNDAFTFGQVAAANAISDVYAMGGSPIMALAILAWPLDKLPLNIANNVIAGARQVCSQINIPLAGGHSIDSPEPVFGLSVTGKVLLSNLKRNNTANEGDVLLLTKPLGLGILSTTAKRELIDDEQHLNILHQYLTQLNSIGEELGKIKGVTALTDVTGFGLAGHLIEMAEGSKLSVELEYSKLPVLEEAKYYLSKRIVPDATYRNWNAYSSKISFETGVNVMEAFSILPDPQTNGGLLIAVNPNNLNEVVALLAKQGYNNFTTPIGKFISATEKVIVVKP